MKAIVFDRFGDPAEVLRVQEVPTPEPGPGEVRVRMIASPVNPSDLLVVRGLYGVLPKLPATPGFEGVGVVDKAGPGLIGRFVRGKRVSVINSAGGNWAEYAVIPAKQARPVASDIPDDQVASFFVNPATVLAMVKHVLAVPKGEWLLQSAAGSSLGKMIIRYCRAEGIRTINVVRRREAAQALLDLGGNEVVVSSETPVNEAVARITGGKGVRYALDPVGGDTGTQVFDSLGDDALLLVYGTLSGEPLRIDPRRMIAGKRVVQGFWLGHWVRGRSIPQNLGLFREIARQMRQGVLTTEVGGRFSLEQVAEAVRSAEQAREAGEGIADDWF
ncbi:MAG: zinc-dependent alcohol dehydrogenase family protein [Isosphaeraceae bacterium]